MGDDIKGDITSQLLCRFITIVGGALALAGTWADNKYLGFLGAILILICPFIEFFAWLCKNFLNELVNTAEQNKRSFGSLYRKICEAETIIETLNRRKAENEEKFGNEVYYSSFGRFCNVNKQIKRFFEDASQLSKVKKYLAAKHIENKLKELYQEYDDCRKMLLLSIQLSTEITMKQSVEALMMDNREMSKFLEHIGDCINETSGQTNTVLKEVVVIKNKLDIIEQD
ncbi:hypothetical protein C1645_790578 [Glomus cerebriforme]|uniref:Uncharacterized protein n=1 Tax=Glomus cerebriforme TaxID=658196 RepID=A0A397S5T1_9GLOM|nr:hypothetical protein C1645_790578 [Glomus cerebriforme]